MASTAYLEVTFTKNIQKQSNFTDSDLGKNFKIESTIGSNPSTIIPIIQATIINNKVRLQISDDDVPKQQTSITLTYTDNSGNLGFGLVDASTGFPIKDLEPVKDAVKTEVETPSGPSIVGAIVEHETPNKITLTFTEKRDVITNSLSTADPASGNNDVKCGYTIGYNSTSDFNIGDKGAYVTPTFDVNGTSSPAVNKIVLTAKTGEFQYGSTVSLNGGGNSFLENNGLVDQFDLSCVEFTEFNVTNNVEQVILDGAYITNTDPSSVLLYFKKGTSGTILDISAEYISPLPQDALDSNVFQVQTFQVFDAGQSDSVLYDVSGVDSVKYTSNELLTAGFSSTLANKYKDMSGVRFKMNLWPFQYGKNIKILWDISGDVPDVCKLEDQYGNKIFNSGYDPKSGTHSDISLCNVTNNIQGIKIKSGNVLDNTGTDLSYNIILDFTTETGTTSISGELVGTSTPSQFKLSKNGGALFSVDKVEQMTDVSKVKIWVDYSKNTFTKIINKGDTVKFSYEPVDPAHSFGNPWPTSIRDAYGNYVRNYGNSNLDIVNNMDYSGNLPSGTYNVEADGKTMNIACDFDISTNSTDEIHGTGGFTFNVADPTGILVDKVEKGADDKTIKLTLNKSLYATSLPTLNYSNSGNITDTVTDEYGIKLNNKTGISVSVSNIPAPGNDNKWIFNSGWYNEMGKLDLSFNPTITSFSEDDRSGFKYQASYTQHNSTFVDLSTNGFVDIPVSNVTFHDNIITLDTGFNQSGASRGFSKKHTSGGDYSIKVKYVGPDLSSNRPKGALGYLPDFEFTMADASNNIWDPSCNPVQDVSKTAIILHDNPSQILVAMQQPAYDGSESQGNLVLKWWDISNILFANDPTLEYDAGAATTSSTAVSRTVGEGGSSGHSSTTNWINATFPLDISSSTINVNWQAAASQTITDQNGGVLPAFDNKLPVTSYVNWIELDGTGGGNNDCIFEQTPVVYPFISADNPNQINVQWDPTLSDYGGMSATAFTAIYNTGSDITQVCTSFTSMSPPNTTENRLVLTFPDSFASATAGSVKIKYTKPVGNAGIKLNYNGGRWLESFDYKPAAGIRLNVKPTMAITSATVTSGTTTADATIALTFTADKTTSNFTVGDITVTNGTISDFAGSGTTYTATFTPAADGACTIDVGAGAFTDIEGDGNTAAAQFSWTKTSITTPTLQSVTVATSNPRKAIFKFSEAVTEPSGNIDQYYDYVGSGENLFYNTAAYGSVNDAPWAIYVDNRKSWQTSEPYWHGDFSANIVDGGGRATEWYLLADGGETQFDSSFNVVFNNTNATTANASGTKVESTSIQSTINVITPYYTKNWDKGSGVDVSSSWIDKDEPNSVYMWFRDASNNADIRDLSDNGNTINTGIDGGHRYLDRYKFVTKNKDAAAEGYPTNIIDVSQVTFLTLPASSSKNPMSVDISAVRFDLSRNTLDISNVINPYSFTSRDEIYMWWKTNNISDDGRLRDLISNPANGNGNEIWDSSANKTGYMTNDVNASVDISGAVSSTTRPNEGDNDWMHEKAYYGLEINNQIRDIQIQSAEVIGSTMGGGDTQYLYLNFQEDISFNLSAPIWSGAPGGQANWLPGDISANDWVLEVSGNSTGGNWVQPSLENYQILEKYKDTATQSSDVSWNALQIWLFEMGQSTAIVSPGDDVQIKMQNMDNKPLGRQYIDSSGNKLVAYKGVNNVGSNTAYFPVTNNASGGFGGGGGEG